MEKANLTVLLEENASTTILSTGHSLVDITPINLAIAIFILLSFLVGTGVNGLFLWLLGTKIKRTVNSLWFLHLILTYVISSTYIPFLAVHILLGLHWVFGVTLCKVINFLASLGMFTTVFLLTIVSLDRHLLVCRPVWSQENRTVPRARRLVAGVWFVSLAMSAPYLAFRETRMVEDGKILCVNNYAFSRDWGDPGTEALRHRVHLTLFLVRFLLAFVTPFCIITGCYCGMGWEMKKKRLARNRKPFLILIVAVVSFFICWLPYHFYHGLLLFKEAPDRLVNSLRASFIIIMCLNFWVTPVLYLLVGEKFQQVCRTSVLVLLKKAFVDVPVLPGSGASDNEEGQTASNANNV